MFRCILRLPVFVALTSLAGSAVMQAQPLAEEQILGDAQARIEKYRTAEAPLRILGPNGKPVDTGASVKIEQTRHRFLFGCNIFKLGRCGSPELDQAYADCFADLLNFGTLPFYWWGYEREQGKPDYARTEEILAWCREHNVTPKGHPLAWNWVEPGWLPDDPAKAMNLQIERIGGCVERFREDIRIWDVVNEATDYGRDGPRQKAPKLTQAIDEMSVASYLRRAFTAARRADPGATLIINDYRTDPAYADLVIEHLMGPGGKPMYDVIGIQSHQHGGAWPSLRIWETCERFAVFGVPLHFTETTFLSGKEGWELRQNEGGWDSTPEGEQRQKENAARFYTILFSHPAVEAITWWDFTDLHSWQGAPAGLLRQDMSPKPVYEALRDLIKGAWWTRTSATVGDDGRVGFRGFLGDYRVTVHADDATWTGAFALDRAVRGPIEVRLSSAP